MNINLFLSVSCNKSLIYSKSGRAGPAGVVFGFWIKVGQFGQRVAP